MKKLSLTVAAIILITTGSGCATTQVEYYQRPLPLPPRPVLPALTAQDLSCISDADYKKLVTRNRLRKQYTEELELIIKSTHEQGD